MAYRRSRNTMGQRMADSAKQNTSRLLADWAELTWRSDTAKVGPVTISALNWILLAVFLAAGYFLANQRLIVAAAAGLWFLFTLGRAAAIMPARRKTLQLIYDQNQKTAGLPRGTASMPADPSDRITVRTWGKKHQPTDLTVTLGDCPSATGRYAQVLVEKSLESALGAAPAGQSWLFSWPTTTQVRVRGAAEDSPEIGQQQYENRVRSVSAKLLKLRVRESSEYNYSCEGWESAQTKAGTTMWTPSTIVLELGDFDHTDLSVRDQMERALDKRLPRPGEWLYNWGSSELTMTQVDRDSIEAKRKQATRKISDDIISLLPGGRREDPPGIRVAQWFDNEHISPDFPRAIEINFDTRNLSDRRKRDDFETGFDQAMSAIYAQVTWLYDWSTNGSTTRLRTKAVPSKSKHAARKFAERRLRNVIESKFGSSRNFVDCDIVEWQDNLTDNGEALPQVATVTFGDYDVTKLETQEAFEQHWNSLTTACDWHYLWTPADGSVKISAVPPLPMAMPFPKPGSDQFDELNTLARKGKMVLGPQKGGGWLTWDLNQIPHALIGGATGAGKSVALSNALFYALYNPDLLELYVCDPKRTDFTWTPEFPNVVRFAATDNEIVAAVAAAKAEMDRRQSLLGKVGVRNIGQLRKKLAENPELVKEHGPAPRRLILFFDELAEFLAKSANKDIEELKDEARADLEAIGRLGRAMEVNILSAAQKPDGKIISTQLREQLGFRMCVGPVNIHTSQQILNSDHGTRFPSSGSPKGRAWAYDPKDGYRMAQGFFLPDETGPLPWDESIVYPGCKDMVRQHLAELGYAETEITNAFGGTEARWVRVEGLDDQPLSFDDEADQSVEYTMIDDTSHDVAVDTPTESGFTIEPEPEQEKPEPEPAPAPASKAPRRPSLSLVPAGGDDEDPFD